MPLLLVPPPLPRIVGYVPNWIDVPAFLAGFDAAKVTHLNVAFENPVDDSGTLSFAGADDLIVAKGHAAGAKVLLSIGGGSAPSDPALSARYARLLEDDARPGFARGLAEYLKAHGFDGLDVDLEGPNIDANYGAFIRDLREALPKGTLLTAALSRGYGGDRVPESALREFDWVNIMAYDATGPWNRERTGPHSGFDFAKENAAYWLGRGLPKAKAVLGVPFYGWGFGASFREAGYPYSEIVGMDPKAAEGDRIGDTVWYDGPATIAAKARWVRAQGLGGVMVWSLDQDAPGERSLLSVLTRVLRP